MRYQFILIEVKKKEYFMYKKLLALVFFFFLIFYQSLFSQEIKTEDKQTELEKHKIVEEWQTNPQAFAKLFYGDDLSKRSPGRGTTLEETHKSVIEKVRGSYVEWPVTYGIWHYWLNSDERAQEQWTDNTSLSVPIGSDGSGWIHVPLCTVNVSDKEATWGIPPQTEVQLKMKLLFIRPTISQDGSLDINLMMGTQLEIVTSSKRCNWPEYSSTILTGNLTFLDHNPRSRIISTNELPIKVGLRKDDKGVDFIIPSNDAVFVVVAPGTYDIYFQFADDPTNLYQGDSINVDSSGFEIQLNGKEAGDYKIRKIK